MSRNPVLSKILTLATLGFFVLAGCKSESEVAELIANERYNYDQLKNEKEKNDKASKKQLEEVQRQLDAIQKHNTELQKAADEYKSQFEQMQDELDKLRKEFKEYTEKYKLSVRSRAKGMILPKLQTSDGKSYDEVVVSEVTATEIKFRHVLGASTVELAKLTQVLQQKFAYDPNEQQEIAASEELKKNLLGAPDEKETQATIKNLKFGKKPDLVAVKRLQERIRARERELRRLNQEASEVNNSSIGKTKLGQVRIDSLRERAARMKLEISQLRAMMEKAAAQG